MIGFLAGSGTAAILAVVTWTALNAFTVTSVERFEEPSLNLRGSIPIDSVSEEE